MDELPLSRRAQGIVNALDVKLLGELAQKNASEILRIRNSGTTLLRSFPKRWRNRDCILEFLFLTGVATLPKRFEINLELTFTGRKASYINRARAHSSRRRIVLEGERNSQLLIKLWGWNGNPARTLESVGNEFGVSRERVRQVEARALRRLAKHRFEVPYLKSAIALLLSEEPDLDEVLAGKLHQRGLAR
jgi:hypothetical protein